MPRLGETIAQLTFYAAAGLWALLFLSFAIPAPSRAIAATGQIVAWRPLGGHHDSYLTRTQAGALNGAEIAVFGVGAVLIALQGRSRGAL